MAVFKGSFDARAEEAICQDERHRYLADLVRRSLVIYDNATGRYRLHDLVRLLARKYLNESNEDTDVNRRYSSYYEAVLREANLLYMEGGRGIKKGLSIFDAEWTNISAGQSWAEQQAERDETAAELCNTYPTAGVYLLEVRLSPQERIRWREAARAASQSLKIKVDEAKHTGYLGEAYRAIGETTLALDLHEQHLRIAQETGDAESEGIAWGGLGNTFDTLGKPRRALECFKHALAIARRIGKRRVEANMLGNIGVTHLRLGEYEQAIRCHKKHLAIAREEGDVRGEAFAMGNLGLVYEKLNDPERLIELNEKALS
ncbi:MAG: tetratricopeptide repeat protein, partial [Acidobacteriota bacterium]|nr:tetratricopeptide repeat protein [Acidobacteriota bacterium]